MQSENLTKREHFAILALAAIVGGKIGKDFMDSDDAARFHKKAVASAIRYADELTAALKENPPKEE
jgi:hypothetical protein